MRCLSDEQIEALASANHARPSRRRLRHVADCGRCAARLVQARADAALTADLRDIAERRVHLQALQREVENRLRATVEP